MSTDAVVTLGMDTSELDRKAKEAQTTVKKMSAGIKTALGAASAAFAVVGGVSALKGLSDEMVNVYNLAKQLGVSGESLQRVSQAAAISGTDVDNLVESMLELDIKLHDAKNGSKEAQSALDAFGLSAENLAGLSLEAKILKLAQAFQNYERNGNGAPILMSLLGDEARELIPLLRTSITELDKMSKTKVVTDDQLAAIKTFDTAILDLSNSAKATAGNVIGEFIKMGAITKGIFENLFEGKSFGEAWQGAFDDQFMKDLEAKIEAAKGIIAKPGAANNGPGAANAPVDGTMGTTTVAAKRPYVLGYEQRRTKEDPELSNPFRSLDAMGAQGASRWQQFQEQPSRYKDLQDSPNPFDAVKKITRPLDVKAQENAKERAEPGNGDLLGELGAMSGYLKTIAGAVV